ncbi:hypothetical protein GCM10010326_01850 [Streptomyces xanthochromogenes]|uniref:Uncharacterized protein n=1 Tax=Streptomyces xanthochromogenes TaxID=67384 RepID=A0ABQ2ZFT0_9ACTN|nr:hypothetical protein GCM10010326_01850 [Streptomyces xanthochromogenes]
MRASTREGCVLGQRDGVGLDEVAGAVYRGLVRGDAGGALTWPLKKEADNQPGDLLAQEEGAELVTL